MSAPADPCTGCCFSYLAVLRFCCWLCCVIAHRSRHTTACSAVSVGAGLRGPQGDGQPTALWLSCSSSWPLVSASWVQGTTPAHAVINTCCNQALQGAPNMIRHSVAECWAVRRCELHPQYALWHIPSQAASTPQRPRSAQCHTLPPTIVMIAVMVKLRFTSLVSCKRA